MKYAIITENDSSKWSDATGSIYHFPKRYLNILQPGTSIIYYKGRLREESFRQKRLSVNPHYFGLGRVGKITKDSNSSKGDHFATIESFIKFSKSVDFRIDDKYIEVIPESKETNYWRDGVREIDEQTYVKIKNLAGLNDETLPIFNDDVENGLESEFYEGGRKQRYTTFFERDARARLQAVTIHGYSCMACDFNFKSTYGDWGEGFIHVHHIQPISTKDEKTKVNPRTDLIVLCANCHSMVHRRRDKILTLAELKIFIEKQKPR